MTELDAIRAEIEKRWDMWIVQARAAEQNAALAHAELEAHDRAVAAMNGATEPARKERRDIAALVLDALTGQPQTPEEIAAAIDARPGQVRAALDRLQDRNKVHVLDDRYSQFVGGILS